MPAIRFGSFQRQIQRKACCGDRTLEQRQRDFLHPLLELSVGKLAANLSLAGAGSGRQVNLRPEVLNVEGQINVLRKALDQPMGLGERRAPFEGEGGEQLLVCPECLQRPDHPDVLF